MAKHVLHTSETQSDSEGFVIVTVLWILGALSALVSIYAIYATNTALGFAEYDNRLRADALFSAALELTAYRQLNIPTQSRPTRDNFSFRLASANVEVAFCSEAARVDLNKAPKELLAGLFRGLGAARENAEIYSERIVAWRTPSSERDASDLRGDPNSGHYPRKSKFPHANELSLVEALPIELVERALPFVTVYSGLAQINMNDAAPEVIAALPGMTPDRVNTFLIQRKAHPELTQDLLRSLGTAQSYVTNEGSRTFRVQTRIAFDNSREARSDVIILLFDQGSEPYSILTWRGHTEGSLAATEPGTRTQ